MCATCCLFKPPFAGVLSTTTTTTVAVRTPRPVCSPPCVHCNWCGCDLHGSRWWVLRVLVPLSAADRGRSLSGGDGMSRVAAAGRGSRCSSSLVVRGGAGDHPQRPRHAGVDEDCSPVSTATPDHGDDPRSPLIRRRSSSPTDCRCCHE